MPFKLYESGSDTEPKKGENATTSIVTGTVTNNCDKIGEGKVLVRIPALSLEVWARLSTIGGGAGAGFLYVPRPDDEVLVALHQNNTDDAYVLGGLWTSSDSPPANAAEATSKRVIKTGMTKGDGHSIEFDDLKRSITIESTTKQKVTIDTDNIKLENSAGSLVITMDSKSQTITIKGVNVSIEAQSKLDLKGGTVTLSSSPGPLTLKSDSKTAISGTLITLN